MTFYHVKVSGSTIPASSCNNQSPNQPVLEYDFVFRRFHRHLLYDTSEVPVLVDFQDYGVLETRKGNVLPLSILDCPLALCAELQGMLAEMGVDPVTELWEAVTQSIIGRSHGLAKEHNNAYSIIVEARLDIVTEEEFYLTNSRSASESTRQRLMETAFRIGPDDPKHGDLDDSCSVCLDELRGEQELIKMPCDHIFHKECIIRWLENAKSCPLCRLSLE